VNFEINKGTHMKREPWTKERLLALLKRYEGGVLQKELAADENCSIPRICQLLAKARVLKSLDDWAASIGLEA
jgi:hypothetical protein